MEEESLVNKSIQTVNDEPVQGEKSKLSDSNLLIEIEVSESFCSRLINENLPEDSLVEVTVIKPDRMNEVPSTSVAFTEQERRKREAQFHIDTKMNELIAKMKDLSKDPKTYKPTGQILHKNIRQQFLSTLGLKSLIEPQKMEKAIHFKECSTQTSAYHEAKMKMPIAKCPFKTKRDQSKYLSSADVTHHSSDWDCSSSVVSNTSMSQKFRNVREPIFTRASIQKTVPVNFENNGKSENLENDNIMNSIPIKLCSSKSQQLLKKYIKELDEKINTDDSKIVQISKPPSKKSNLLKRLSFIKIKKNSIIFKKKNSKKEKLKEETTNDQPKEKDDLFQSLNHLPETTISQNNLNSLRKIEMSDESVVQKKDSMLRMILTLENQLVSIIEKDDLVWELGREQERYRVRESDSKETNPSLYKLSAKIKNDQDSICNVSVANQSVNSKIKENLLKDKESVSKSDQSFCISKRGRVLDSTSDWQTIEDEMSSQGGTKVVAKEKEPFGNLKDRVYIQQRVDLPGPWHPFCQDSYNDTSPMLRDPNRERYQRRGPSGGWSSRPWSAPTPASRNLPTGSVWFWDGSQLRPAYDLRDRVEDILLDELDQTETHHNFTRIPIPRDPNEKFPRFVNNDYLSRMVELKQSLERPHLPPPLPLESVIPSFKKRSSSRTSSLISTLAHLRTVKLQRDPPKTEVKPERHIRQQEYVAITAPPYQVSKRPSTKSLHVTYLNPLLTNVAQEKKAQSRPHKYPRDSPQEESSTRRTKRLSNRRRFRNARDSSDFGVLRRSNLHNHHLYELMRCAQKRQVRKLSDDPEDFEIELELTSKDLCRVLGMNTLLSLDSKDSAKRKVSSSQRTKASPRSNPQSRGPSPASGTFKGTTKDHHRKTDTNQGRTKLKVGAKQREMSPKGIATSPERRSQKSSSGQLRKSQGSRSPTSELRTSGHHQVRFGHMSKKTSQSSKDQQASNIN